MKPAAFDYYRPESVAEAIEVLGAHDDAKVLAGGQSLVPMMNMRLARPAALVDIGHIPGLDAVAADGSLWIGATARQADVLADAAIRMGWPLVTAALWHVGHPATRARGTFGGSIAHGEPAAELAAVALALDAQITAEGPGGSRVIAADDFFLGHYTTALAEDEVLVHVEFPRAGGSFWAFEEVARRHGDYAMAGVAARLDVDGEGVVTAARIALFGVAALPIRARSAEAAVIGAPVGDAGAAERAGAVALEGIEVADDTFVSAAYRIDATAAVVTRALVAATAHPRNGSGS